MLQNRDQGSAIRDQEGARSKPQGTRILYVSPLKALAVDVERNLRSPLGGIANMARRRGVSFHEPQISIRTGDTPQREREALPSPPIRFPSSPPPRVALPDADLEGRRRLARRQRPSSSTRSTPWFPPSAAPIWHSRWSEAREQTPPSAHRTLRRAASPRRGSRAFSAVWISLWKNRRLQNPQDYLSQPIQQVGTLSLKYQVNSRSSHPSPSIRPKSHPSFIVLSP